MAPCDGTAAVAVLGAGIAGIATAYFLAVDHGIADVVLVDAGQPMAFTSAQSGDNYRNWWPHPTMAALKIVDAAGPFAARIAEMIGVDLPVHNTLQQKLAFEDTARAIPRDMPFSIDLDRQRIDWTDDEREMLREEPELERLAGEMPGAIHCRPDGGVRGTWVKLGWAFNERTAAPEWNPSLDPHFPKIVLRGASRLHPSLDRYVDDLPRRRHHYGGWYTMTSENWPLIGPMGPEGAFMSCAYSGFGTMAACAGGELCAAWVADAPLPNYARELSLQRYDDAELMTLLSKSRRGVL